jgi:starch synthase
MGPAINMHQGKYGGVLNGIDYGMWNPEIDPLIAAHYTWQTLENKASNKNALRDRLLLRNGHKPIIASVGRLDPQKGVHLIRHALFYALDRGAQFVLLGSSPVAQINDEFWGLKRRFNDNPDCHLEVGYNEELAHLIYAGADMMVVPSLFEPCGLTQMIALRYGTVPIVRWTGGLADTVFDRDYAPKPIHERNGYTFNEATPGSLESAMDRAMGLWQYYPGEFYKLMVNGMKYDFSWHQPGTHYLNIYEFIRDK